MHSSELILLSQVLPEILVLFAWRGWDGTFWCKSKASVVLKTALASCLIEAQVVSVLLLALLLCLGRRAHRRDRELTQDKCDDDRCTYFSDDSWFKAAYCLPHIHSPLPGEFPQHQLSPALVLLLFVVVSPREWWLLPCRKFLCPHCVSTFRMFHSENMSWYRMYELCLLSFSFSEETLPGGEILRRFESTRRKKNWGFVAFPFLFLGVEKVCVHILLCFWSCLLRTQTTREKG